jgi:serine/threonine protein kinase
MALGAGASGLVELCYDRKLDRLVAIKTMHADPARDADARQAFLHEARLLGAYDHPNIVDIFDVGETDEEEPRPYLVMRYMDGGSLHARLREAANPDAGRMVIEPGLAITWLAQAATGLDHLHENRVVHRDIKPSNLLTEDAHGRVVIADLGISRLIDDVAWQGSDHTGTEGYIAPERFDGQAVPASDQYSLAVTAHVVLLGRMPRRRFDSDPGLGPGDPSDTTGVLAGAAEVLSIALDPHPGKRFESCTAFVGELSLATSEHTGSAGRAIRSPKVPDPELAAAYAQHARATMFAAGPLLRRPTLRGAGELVGSAIVGLAELALFAACVTLRHFLPSITPIVFGMVVALDVIGFVSRQVIKRSDTKLSDGGELVMTALSEISLVWGAIGMGWIVNDWLL